MDTIKGNKQPNCTFLNFYSDNTWYFIQPSTDGPYREGYRKMWLSVFMHKWRTCGFLWIEQMTVKCCESSCTTTMSFEMSFRSLECHHEWTCLLCVRWELGWRWSYGETCLVKKRTGKELAHGTKRVWWGRHVGSTFTHGETHISNSNPEMRGTNSPTSFKETPQSVLSSVYTPLGTSETCEDTAACTKHYGKKKKKSHPLHILPFRTRTKRSYFIAEKMPNQNKGLPSDQFPEVSFFFFFFFFFRKT